MSVFVYFFTYQHHLLQWIRQMAEKVFMVHNPVQKNGKGSEIQKLHKDTNFHAYGYITFSFLHSSHLSFYLSYFHFKSMPSLCTCVHDTSPCTCTHRQQTQVLVLGFYFLFVSCFLLCTPGQLIHKYTGLLSAIHPSH